MNTRVLCRILLWVAVAYFSAGARANTTNITSSADTTLWELEPNNNLGGEVDTIVGKIGTGYLGRVLYKFDLTNVFPVDATITGAALKLTVGSANAVGKSFSLHRVLRAWGEGVGAGGGNGTGTHGSPANAGEATWLSCFHPTILLEHRRRPKRIGFRRARQRLDQPGRQLAHIR